MTKEVHCAEVGLYPDCEAVVRGEDDAEIMEKVARHGREEHGMTEADFTGDTIQRIKAAVREV